MKVMFHWGGMASLVIKPPKYTPIIMADQNQERKNTRLNKFYKIDYISKCVAVIAHDN